MQTIWGLRNALWRNHHWYYFMKLLIPWIIESCEAPRPWGPGPLCPSTLLLAAMKVGSTYFLCSQSKHHCMQSLPVDFCNIPRLKFFSCAGDFSPTQTHQLSAVVAAADFLTKWLSQLCKIVFWQDNFIPYSQLYTKISCTKCLSS